MQPTQPTELDPAPGDVPLVEPPMQYMPPAATSRFWPPGVSGNPKGRPPGQRYGRGAALYILDQILQEEETRAAIRNALRKYILARPVAAFKTLVMPLLPKDVRVDVASQRVVVWRSFMDEVGMKTVQGEGVRPTGAVALECPPASPTRCVFATTPAQQQADSR